MSSSEPSNKFNRTIRSFVLRQGRLTSGQQFALENFWSAFGIEHSAGQNEHLNFNALFGNDQPVILEIGFGNGESLAEMAKADPSSNFIGIEVHRPGVGHLLHLIDKYELKNLRIFNEDAVDIIRHRIAEHSLARVQLYFPDPWHKKKHNKRRIVQPAFANLIHSKLVIGGQFHMATDWQAYAEHMAEVMENQQNYKSLNDTPYSEKPDYRPTTKFETRGIKRGHGVWDLIYTSI